MSSYERRSGLVASGAYAPVLTPVATQTANYAAQPGDLVPVDTTSGSITVTLPTAPADRTRVAVKQVTRGGTNTVSVAVGGSDHIATGNATSRTVTLLGEAVELLYQASTALWFITASDTPVPQLDLRYAHLTGGNTLSGDQVISSGSIVQDYAVDASHAPNFSQYGFNGRWYAGGLDLANTPRSRDYVPVAKYATYSINDAATTSGSPTMTSAAEGNFTAGQVNNVLSGAGIPNATTVLRLPATTIAVASNGAVLPQATINVADTTDFAAAGTALVTTSTGQQVVTYTGKTGTTFTGCTGGAGTMSTGGAVGTNTQVVMSANATATATGVRVTLTSPTNTLQDIIYLSHNGGASPLIGIAYTPPPTTHRMAIAADDGNLALGNLRLRVSAGQTGDVLTVTDSTGTSKVSLDSAYRFNGLAAKADSSGNATAIGIVSNDTLTQYSFTMPTASGNAMRVRCASTSTSVMDFGTDGHVTFYGTANINGTLAMTDGHNMTTGTTTGSKFGTATTQKIGFWNHAPVVQPAGTPTDATDLASALTLVNFIKNSVLLATGLAA